MFHSKVFYSVFLYSFAFLLILGCNAATDSSGAEEGKKTAKVLLKATVTDNGNTELSTMALAAGTLEIKNALFRIDDFQL